MAKRYLRKRARLYDIKGIDALKASTDLPIKTVEAMENCSFKKGVLGRYEMDRSMISLKDQILTMPPTTNCRMMPYSGKTNDKRLLVAWGANGLFVFDLMYKGAWKKLSEVWVHTCAVVNHDNLPYLLVAAEYGKQLLFDGVELQQVEEKAPVLFNYLATHYGRVFASNTSGIPTLYFSDETTPYNWNESIDEGGHISFDINHGSIAGLISFNEYLYAFSEYSIYRITAFGDQTEFAVKKLDVNIGRIVANTMVDCGGIIVFYTTMGIVLFDGYSCRVLKPELMIVNRHQVDSIFNINVYATACFVNNKYYLATKSKIIIMDMEDYSYCIDNYDYPVSVCADKKLNRVVVFNGNDYNNGDTLKSYVDYKCKTRRMARVDSGVLDFGSDSADKVIRNIYFNPDVRGGLIIKSDMEERHFSLIGQDKVVVNMRGKTFQITLRADSNGLRLSSPIVEYDISA